MKQTVLGQPPYSYKKALDRAVRVCIVAAALTLVAHIFLTVMRTENNHHLLLWINVGCDILCGFFLVYQICARIQPSRRLYALYTHEKQELEGAVTSISPAPVRYMDMDCYEVTAAGRRLFLPVGTIRLQESEAYRFSVTANTIVEAEQ